MLSLFSEFLELRLEAADAFPRASSPDFELRLTRTPASDTASEARKRVVPLPESRQEVPHLRELYLQLAVARFGVLGEDIENELGAIYNLEIGHSRDVVRLGRSEVAVENQRLGVELHGSDDHVLELAASERVSGVDSVANLQHSVSDLDSRRARKLFQLTERVIRLAGASFVTDMDQDCAPVLRGDSARPGGSGELLLQSGNDLRGVVASLCIRNWSERAERRFIAIAENREVVPVVQA